MRLPRRLMRRADELEPGAALDLACGAGRNALYLGQHHAGPCLNRGSVLYPAFSVRSAALVARVPTSRRRMYFCTRDLSARSVSISSEISLQVLMFLRVRHAGETF
jgi:hypothetical protein